MDIFKSNKKNGCGPRATRLLQIFALQVIVLLLLFFPKNLSSATAPIFNLGFGYAAGFGGYAPVFGGETETFDDEMEFSNEMEFSIMVLEYGSSSGFLWKGEGEISSLFSIYGIAGLDGRLAWLDLGFGGFKDYLSLEADAYTVDPYLSPMMHHIVLGIRQHPFLGWDPLQLNIIRSLDLTIGLGISPTPNVDILLSAYGAWGTSDFSGSWNTFSVLGDLALFVTLDSLEKSHQIFLKLATGASLSDGVKLDSIDDDRVKLFSPFSSSPLISDSAFTVKGSLGYSYSQFNEDDEFRERTVGVDVFYAHAAYLYDNSAFYYSEDDNSYEISSVESRLKQTDELTFMLTSGKVIGIKAFYNFRLSYSDAELFLPGNCRDCDDYYDYFELHYIVLYNGGRYSDFYRSQMDDYIENSLGIELIYPTRFVAGIKVAYAVEIRDYYRRVDFLNQNSIAPILASVGPTGVRQQVKIGVPIKFCEGLTSSFEPFYQYNYERSNGFSEDGPDSTIEIHSFGFELQYRLKGRCQV